MRTSKHELVKMVDVLNRISGGQDLRLDGAYGGWRVENGRGEDVLGTGFTAPKTLKIALVAVTQFQRDRMRV